MPLPLLLDWVYATFVAGMDSEKREEFDFKLNEVRNAEELAAKRAEQAAELKRLNAHRR